MSRLIIEKNPYGWRALKFLTATFLFLILNAHASPAPSAPVIATHLPPTGSLSGWAMKGKPEFYVPGNLYKHINGEAELYLSYGFERLEFALYVRITEKDVALTVDIYTMGSLLDAFGIYSHYRDPEATPLNMEAEGFATDSQLMFYKGRYFVQLSSSGAAPPSRHTFINFAETILKKLPDSPVEPEEVALLKAPGVIKNTCKYSATSLMGYTFFERGFAAQAIRNGKTVKVFVVINDTADKAKRAFDRYAAYLKQAGNEPKVISGKDSMALIAHDPLYKGVTVRQRGSYLFGVSNIEDPTDGFSILDQWTDPGINKEIENQL